MEKLKNIYNNCLVYIKTNRNNLYIIGAIILLFLLSSGLVALIASRSKSTTIPNQGTNPSQKTSQVSPSITNPQPTLDGPILTPEPTEAAMIENQTEP